MPDMNESIEKLRAQYAEEETQARERIKSEEADVRKHNEQFLRVAQGLIILSGLLADSGAPSEGWVKYQRGKRNFGGIFADTGMPCSDGRAEMIHKFNHPRPLLRSIMDSFWYLGGFDIDIGNGEYEHIIKDGGHHYITESRRIIGDTPGGRHFIELDTITEPDSAARLVILGRSPSEVANHIIWTAANYDLKWPSDAPDLSDLR